MITSKQNKQVKNWKKLYQHKYRKQTGTFLVEGFHLVEEAFCSDWTIEKILLREDVRLPDWAKNLSVATLSAHVFQEIAATKTSQGIAAIVKMHTNKMCLTGPVLLTDAVQDPGNLGTMIRTADALGFSQVILGDGTADIFNAKVIRASQGSMFHVSVLEMNLELAITELKRQAYTVWAGDTEEAVALQEAVLTPQSALIVGNEGDGISPPVKEAADGALMVPVIGKAESLNVAVAAGIMMYAIANQK